MQGGRIGVSCFKYCAPTKYSIVVVIKEKESCWNTHATYCTHALRFVAIGEGALNAAKNIHRKLGAHKMAMEFKSFVKCFIDSAFRYLYYPPAAVACCLFSQCYIMHVHMYIHECKYELKCLLHYWTYNDIIINNFLS